MKHGQQLDFHDYDGRPLCLGDWVRGGATCQIVMVHSVPYLHELGKTEEDFLSEDVYTWPELQSRVCPEKDGKINYRYVDLEHEAE